MTIDEMVFKARYPLPEAIFFLVICLIIAHLTYKFIERLFISYSKRLIKTI